MPRKRKFTPDLLPRGMVPKARRAREFIRRRATPAGGDAKGGEALRPDILVLDLAMPVLPGLEGMRGMATASPGTKVVVLSMYSDEAYVVQALRNGAVAYLVKGAGDDQLITAIRHATSR